MSSVIQNQLRDILRGRVLIVGIGNPLKGDDGFGSLLARELKGKTNATVIDAQDTPENFLGKIVQAEPNTILFIDAADFKEKPGTTRLFKVDELNNTHYFSTHNLPISLLIDFLETKTNARIFFLGIQPELIQLKEGLSKTLKDKKEELKEFFREKLSSIKNT